VKDKKTFKIIKHYLGKRDLNLKQTSRHRVLWSKCILNRFYFRNIFGYIFYPLGYYIFCYGVSNYRR
jgi:hypothetical protein